MKRVPRLQRAVLLALTLAIASSVGAIDQPADAFTRPEISIEVGLELAKQALASRGVDVSSHFLTEIRFDPNPRGDRGPFWRVQWQPARPVKGGVVVVHVYMNRTTEVIFLE